MVARTESRATNETRKPTSRNVYLMIALCFGWGLADSIWTGTLIVAWIFLLSGGSNSAVGYIEAASGLAGLVTALPIGFLADKVGRSPVIKIRGIILIVATFTTGYAVYYKPEGDYYWLGASQCLWGIGGGILNGPAQALFADSLEQGERSLWYSRLFSAYIVPSVLGPIIAIVLFKVYGDHWTFEELRPIIIIGLALEIPVAVGSFFFRDDLALEENLLKKDRGSLEEGDDAAVGAIGNNSQNNCENAKSEAATPATTSGAKGWCGCTTSAVPYIMFASSLLCALGSGMTIKFFPLFFKDTLSLAPASVQLIYVLVPIVMVLCVQIVQKVGTIFGRVQTMLVVRAAGVSLLMSMSILINDGFKEWFYCVPIYIIRTAIMNATTPLEESIVMDFVPASTRARWKALDSISIFGWCGSAALGGVLADKFSYSFTFQITALLQGISGLILVLLLPLVPVKENLKDEEQNDPSSLPELNINGTQKVVKKELEEPLL